MNYYDDGIYREPQNLPFGGMQPNQENHLNQSNQPPFMPGAMTAYPPPPPKQIPGKTETKDLAMVGKCLDNCFNRYTYVWLRNGMSFWTWVIAIFDTYIVCYRWNGNRWIFVQIGKRNIDFYVCS